MKRVAFSAFVTIALFFLQLPVISSAAEPVREKVDANIPMVAALNLCKTTTQLDCIESVVIISEDGKRLPALQTSPASEFEENENKQRVESGASTWKYTTSSGTTNSFVLDATLTTPTFVAAGSIDEVGVVSPSESTSVAESETATEKVNIDTRFFDPKLSIAGIFSKGDQSFPSKKLLDAELLEVVVRTSWLQIEETFLPGKKSDIKIDSIAGGKKITLTGSEVIQVTRQSCTRCLTGVVTFSTIEKEDFEFLILHPKKEQKSCQEKGFKVTSTNASSLSLSDQNFSNSIQFNISGYGFRIDGSVNPGFAIIRMPLSWISCQFPNSDLPIADTFNVKVNSTDGSTKPQNASAKAILAGTLLEVTVENFTFAQTEIVIEASVEHIVTKKKQASEAQAASEKAAAEKIIADAKNKADKIIGTAKAAVSKKTITCIKGKVTKKVTAVSPKCPAGYKKK
jgi:hypothetical protein